MPRRLWRKRDRSRGPRRHPATLAHAAEDAAFYLCHKATTPSLGDWFFGLVIFAGSSRQATLSASGPFRGTNAEASGLLSPYATA